MASAISSFPVPVSPLINTVASVGATIRAIPRARRSAALLPTMRGNPLPQNSLLSIAIFDDVASSISKHAGWLIADDAILQVALAAINLTPFVRCAFDPSLFWLIVELIALAYNPRR